MRRILLTLALIFTCSVPAAAHEFWISPQQYQVVEGEAILAALRVGQGFEGAEQPYLPGQTARFDLVRGKQVVPVVSRIGDRPAVHQEVPDQGLWIVVHETTDQKLRYDKYETFQGFVTHKGFPDVLTEHRRRGLPEAGFREAYRRFAKALVAVGDGEGADRQVGLRTEIVAGLNPYTDDLSQGLPVQVFFEGNPRVGAQVELFAKRDGVVEITTYRTDAEGRVTLPVTPGTEYLVDAVTLLPRAAEAETDPVWESLWAALTFQTPR